MSTIKDMDTKLAAIRTQHSRFCAVTASVRAELAAASEMFSAAVKARTTLRDQLMAGIVVDPEVIMNAQRHEMACADDVERLREELDDAQKREYGAKGQIEEAAADLLRECAAIVNLERNK